MTRITTENELMEMFRPVDRDEVTATPLHFPLILRDYLSWREPSGHRVYVVYEDPVQKGARGIVFRRGNTPAEPTMNMCEWCHSVRGGNTIGLLTATASSKTRVGLHLCRDLSCRENALSTPGVNDMPEYLDGQQKVMRIVQRISDFARRNLF